MNKAALPVLYTLLAAVDASAPSLHAVDFAASMVANMVSYRLVVVYVTALNKTSRLPYFDHLDKAYNLEIQDEATTAIDQCKSYLQRFDNKISYDFIEVEGEGEIGPILEKYIAENEPQCSLVVVGTSNQSGIKRMILGSVSEYCVHHLPCPVVVVKPQDHVPRQFTEVA